MGLTPGTAPPPGNFPLQLDPSNPLLRLIPSLAGVSASTGSTFPSPTFPLAKSLPGLKIPVAAMSSPTAAPLASTQSGMTLGAPKIPPPSAVMPGTIDQHNLLVSQMQQNTANDLARQQAAQQRVDYLNRSGSGVDQIAHPVDANGNPTTQHPGFWRTLGSIGAHIGDAALTIAAPGVAALTPGTTLHHQMLLNQATGQEGQAEKALDSQATLADTVARTRLTNDQAAIAEAPSTPDYDYVDTPQGKVGILKGTTNATPVMGPDGKQVPSKQPDMQHIITDNGIFSFNPQSGEAHQLSDENGQPLAAPQKLTESQPILGSDHKPHTYMLDSKGNKVVDLGVHYERPAVSVDAGTKNLWSVPNPDGTKRVVSLKAGDTIPAGALSLSGTNSENVSGDKTTAADSVAQANLDNELGLMRQFAAQPSPTNDAAMLIHYIGATKPESMGKIRLNENEIKLFGGTRSSLGDAEALLTKVSNGQSLTPQQRQDMINTMTMISDAHRRTAGSAATAQNAGGSAPPMQAAPAGMVKVQIPGQAPGYIPQNAINGFLKDHPNAQVMQ